MTDQLLTAEEVADYLQIPVGTMYSWRHRGYGPPALKVGGALRFREIDVQNWLAEIASQEASAS